MPPEKRLVAGARDRTRMKGTGQTVKEIDSSVGEAYSFKDERL